MLLYPKKKRSTKNILSKIWVTHQNIICEIFHICVHLRDKSSIFVAKYHKNMNWFYSLTYTLTSAEVESLSQAFAAFLAQWKSHGTPVTGKIDIKYARFIHISLAQSSENPSGCSIDSMRHAVEKILLSHQLTWAEASNVFFKAENGEIRHTDFRQIPQLVAENALHAESIVFDNSLSDTGLLEKWEVKMADTWMKRYLKVRV